MALSNNQRLRLAFEALSKVDDGLLLVSPGADLPPRLPGPPANPPIDSIALARLAVTEAMLHVRSAIRAEEGYAARVMP